MQAFLGRQDLKMTALSQLTSRKELIPRWLSAKENELSVATGGFADSYVNLFTRVEREYGIPVLVARLIYSICRSTSGSTYWEPFLRCVEAIRPGADLSPVWAWFAAWRLADPVHGVAGRFAPTTDISGLLRRVADMCVSGGKSTSSVEWQAANALLPQSFGDRSFAECMAGNVIDSFLPDSAKSLAGKSDAVYWLVETSAHAEGERITALYPVAPLSWSRGSFAKTAEYVLMHSKLLELLRAA